MRQRTSPPATQCVELETDGPVTIITLSRPTRRNAVDRAMATALRDAQMWMKNLTLDELEAHLSEYAHLPNYPKISRRFNRWRRKNNVCPFADPYYWAAFQVTGNSSSEVTNYE